MTAEVPIYKHTKEVSEDSIKTLSVEECVSLRKDLQNALRLLNSMNPGIINRLLTATNERLFEANQHAGGFEFDMTAE